jgi:DNA-binding transcriptional LysR family regulator
MSNTAAALQLPHLETFARAAELNSFTATARALGLTQAAVSQRIQALEQSLGAALFDRQGGRLLLTEAGRTLHPYAERVLALHQEARQAVTGKRPRLAGELFLAASSVPGEHLLPDLLSEFRHRQPHVQVRVAVSDSAAVLRQVEHGQAHLGLVGGKADSAHLEFRCFACDQLVLVVPARHPWGRRKRVSLRLLAAEPLILREAGSGSRWCLERALAKTGKSLRDLHVALELGSNEGIKEAVARGLGLAILSTHAVQQDILAGKLHGVQVTGLPLVRDMFVVWDRRRALPIPARLFLDLLEPCPGAASPS